MSQILFQYNLKKKFRNLYFFIFFAFKHKYIPLNSIITFMIMNNLKYKNVNISITPSMNQSSLKKAMLTYINTKNYISKLYLSCNIIKYFILKQALP